MAIQSRFRSEQLSVVRRAFQAHAALLFVPGEGPEHVLADADIEPGSTARVAPNTLIIPGKGLVGWIVRNRQALIVNSFDQRSSHLGYYGAAQEDHVTAFMGCPLSCGGVVCVDTNRPVQFSENDLYLLQCLAELCSQQNLPATTQEPSTAYLKHIERIQDLRRHYPHWGDYVANFLEFLVEATPFSHVSFAAIAPNDEHFTVEAENPDLLVRHVRVPLAGQQPGLRLPLSGSLVGWVLRNEVAVHADGKEGSPAMPLYGKIPGLPSFEAVACLPVTVNKSTSAVLSLAAQEPLSIDPQLRSFIRMAVAELEHYLETLYLRHRISALLPKAKIHHQGATSYNPDTAPHARAEDE